VWSVITCLSFYVPLSCSIRIRPLSSCQNHKCSFEQLTYRPLPRRNRSSVPSPPLSCVLTVVVFSSLSKKSNFLSLLLQMLHPSAFTLWSHASFFLLITGRIFPYLIGEPNPLPRWRRTFFVVSLLPPSSRTISKFFFLLNTSVGVNPSPPRYHSTIFLLLREISLKFFPSRRGMDYAAIPSFFYWGFFFFVPFPFPPPFSSELAVRKF